MVRAGTGEPEGAPSSAPPGIRILHCKVMTAQAEGSAGRGAEDTRRERSRESRSAPQSPQPSERIKL